MAGADETARFLLFVRERVRPGVEAAYDENERQIARACVTHGCPHPYLALMAASEPGEVWWLNAAASEAETDDLDAAYARNAPLMAAIGPLGKRKQDFRESVTSDLLVYRPDLSHDVTLQLAGARFLVLSPATGGDPSPAAVFDAANGDRLAVRAAGGDDSAEQLATRLGATALILAVQPHWSVPAAPWIAADPDFWNKSME
jgi:hypothetical protein